VDGVTAGNTTRGHRFLAPEPIELAGPADYVERLRKAYVLVGGTERKRAVLEEVRRAAAACGGRALEDEALVNEVANLVEWPTAVVGPFDAACLHLPRAVPVTPMGGQLRYLPRVDEAGRPLPVFAAERHGPREDLDVIRRGNEKVLAARLADARLFSDEDRRKPVAG